MLYKSIFITRWFLTYLFSVILVHTSKNELQFHCIRKSDVIGKLRIQVLHQVFNWIKKYRFKLLAGSLQVITEIPVDTGAFHHHFKNISADIIEWSLYGMQNYQKGLVNSKKKIKTTHLMLKCDSLFLWRIFTLSLLLAVLVRPAWILAKDSAHYMTA